MTIRYLALGDSYTIGTGSSGESRNFPSLLASQLEAATGERVEVKNPAVNGFTTKDLIRQELPLLPQFQPDLVTILIGANDVVQGFDEGSYRGRLRTIYGDVQKLGLPDGRVVVISVPDFSVVGAAPSFGVPARLRARIDSFNRIAQEEASAHGFDYIDLSELSRSGIGRAGWISDDDLHPADSQYQAWADHIWSIVRPKWGTLTRRRP